MTLDKGNCDECGCKLVDYDLNYSNGQIKLCEHCFDKYAEGHHVIVKHCPACVENGGDFEFYIWEGIEKFLKDHPIKDGWEYRYSAHETQGFIMMDALYKTEWWVLWIAKDPYVMEELRKKLSPMIYKREKA